MKMMDLHIKARKYCDFCNKYNYPEAKYCNYCGEVILDEKVYFICWFESPDLLQSKSKDKNTRNDTEP